MRQFLAPAALALLLLPVVSFAADPVVSNVRVEPRRDGSNLADIYYDLSDADTDTLKVWVEVSADGGGTWTKLERVTGDVGDHVLVGLGKHVVWKTPAEFGVGTGPGYQARVVADDTPRWTIGMVWIPGGTFQMGDAFKEGSSDERPVHTVTVDGFWMDEHEVTNAQYRQYDSGHSSGSYSGHGLNVDDQPVVYVSWRVAIEYCNWRSEREGLERCYNESTGACDFTKSGYRLPTEAEWEYAARGGLAGKRYPWGDQDPVCSAGTTNGARYDDDDRCNQIGTAPVGTYSANGYGLYDMAGNVWEWCSDSYGSYSGGPASNPAGPATGSDRVLRGGSWSVYPSFLRCASRSVGYPPLSYYDFGFRCVSSP